MHVRLSEQLECGVNMLRSVLRGRKDDDAGEIARKPYGHRRHLPAHEIGVLRPRRSVETPCDVTR